MQIQLNGSDTEVPEDIALASLLERLGLVDQRIAVEVNEELVPRGRFSGHRLRPGDRVEIIHAVGGG